MPRDESSGAMQQSVSLPRHNKLIGCHQPSHHCNITVTLLSRCHAGIAQSRCCSRSDLLPSSSSLQLSLRKLDSGHRNDSYMNICFLWHDNHWKIWKIQVVLMKTIIDYLLIIDHWRFMYLCKYCKYCLNLIAWLLAEIAQKEILKNTNYSRVSPLHRFINIFKNHVSFQIKVKIKTIWTNAIRSIVLVDNI